MTQQQQRRFALLLATCFPLLSFGFQGVVPIKSSSSTTQLFGLFDGVKDAFSAPTLERSQIDSERETPIDRWMGWSVASENKKSNQIKAIGTCGC